MSQESFTFAMTAVQAAIIGIGLIGNLLSIIIFLRKTFRSNSISTYCIALSIVQCTSLTQLIVAIYSLVYSINLSNQSDSLCKFFNSMPAFLSGIQPWIMVAFALDKLLCMRAKRIAILKKKWFQWSVVAGIVLINTAIYIHMPILMRRREIFPGYFMCDLSTITNFKVSVIVNLVESGFIPFIIMVFTSIITTRMLIKSRNAAMKTGQVSKERKSRDRKYAISSLSFNVLFVLFKLPGLIFFTMNAFFGYFDMYFLMLATFSFNFNSTLSFFIHLVTNSLFRREFLVLFRLANMRNSGSTLSHTISRTNNPIRLNQVSAAL